MLVLTAEPIAMSAELLADLMCYAGFALWTYAYWQFIQQGIRDNTYGVPLVSVCLNLTWELYFVAKCPFSGERRGDLCTTTGVEYYGLIIWLALDCWIFWQLFTNDWKKHPSLLNFLPERARQSVFYAFIVLLCLVASYWQYAFVNLLTDQDGNTLAWLTNYIMSWLFVASAVFRPNARGLSYKGAWAMLLGNVAFAVWGVLTDFEELTAWPYEVTLVLMVGVILVNMFYLFVLWQRRRAGEVGDTQVPRSAIPWLHPAPGRSV